MAANPLKGEEPLVLAGETCTLVFNYDALERLQALLGASWEAELNGALLKSDVKIIAEVLAIGLEARQPGKWSAEKIRALSPPLFAISQAITLAVKRAYWGDGEPPELPSEDTPRPQTGHRRTKSWWPFGRRFATG